MKWKGWIGGVLLVMMLFGTLGCGKKRGPVTGGMVDGPGMMYTPEDQSPFAGKWQSRDGSIVMEVESSDPLESSRIQVFVNGEGEYGKSNPDATGRADLPTMQKVRQELWDMSSSKSSKLTYDDIKAMLGGEDGIPHTGMDERSWNSEKHAYGWFNGEGDYYVLYFVVRDGDEYYTAASFSSSVRGDS